MIYCTWYFSTWVLGLRPDWDNWSSMTHLCFKSDKWRILYVSSLASWASCQSQVWQVLLSGSKISDFRRVLAQQARLDPWIQDFWAKILLKSWIHASKISGPRPSWNLGSWIQETRLDNSSLSERQHFPHLRRIDNNARQTWSFVGYCLLPDLRCPC